LISRAPKKVNETDELYPLDVNDLVKLDKAIEGSEVLYLVIGFEYKLSVWQKTWPPFLSAVIHACKKHNVKLVFFDNVYMYATSAISHMTETSPMAVTSKKGEIRKQLHEMIMNEVEKNALTALIVRSADFYGPDNKSSALNMMVFDNLMKGKKAQAFGNINKLHNYTFTPDAAKATALLGNTSDAYNQVWHVPTTKEKLATIHWIQKIANELKVDARIQTIPVWMMHVLGLFIPVMKEFPEMVYQYDRDYFFDSSKFEKRFGVVSTKPEEGIRILVERLKTQNAIK
jgi:nucleoside-diphosphate-sugar epimerase